MRHIDAERNGIERTLLPHGSTQSLQVRRRFEGKLRPVTGVVKLVACQSVLAGVFFHVVAACFDPDFIMSV